MTTEPETRRVLNVEIPEDWAAEFHAGHVVIAPADFRSPMIKTDGVKVIAAGKSGPEPFWTHGLDHLSNLSSVLGQAGYSIREFPPG